MKKKSYIIQYLTKYSGTDEQIIRKDLKQFWQDYPIHGVDGICGYIINGKWEFRDSKEVAREVLIDVQEKNRQGEPPFTQRYWVVMTDKYKLRKP